MKKINLFVYGSLREGFFNYDKYLAGKVVEKKDASLENMRLYHMPYKGYPAITPGNDKVLGEIMVINEEPYFLSNKDWFYYDEEEFCYKLTDKVTKEAVKSYEEFYNNFDDMYILD